VLHGLGGVVDEVAEGALGGLGVGEDEREIGRKVLDEADALVAAWLSETEGEGWGSYRSLGRGSWGTRRTRCSGLRYGLSY